MRKLFIVVPVVAGLLAGCNPETTAKIEKAISVAGTVSVKLVDSVQAIALTSCAFVPTAATIATIVSAGSAAAPSQMATAVCAAITAAPKLGAMSIAPTITINGQIIPVEGHYIARGK